MTRLQRFACTFGLAVAMTVAGASAASASTFFLNGTSGSDANLCTSPGAPCKTIGAAITKSEAVLGAATIEVAAGVYQELINLNHPADNGIAINGVGPSTEIKGPVAAKSTTVSIGAPGNATTLSNLSVVNPTGDVEDGISAASEVTLNNVSVDMQDAGEGDGVVTGEIGSLTMNGGSVTMESGATGDAVAAEFDQLTLNGTLITLADGATGAGVVAGFAPLSLTNVTVNIGNAGKGGGIEASIGTMSLSNVAVNVSSSSSVGVELALPNSLSVTGLKVAMNNSGSEPAVVSIFGVGTFDQVEVGGTWTGPAFESEGGGVTLSDSHLTTSPTSGGPVVAVVGAGEGQGLLIQRSVLHATPEAKPGALLLVSSNSTVDSSEILGGTSGVALLQSESKARTATIASSTIDAGTPGERDPTGVFGVTAAASGEHGIANVNVAGSILFEPQQALVEPGENAANVTCSYSDVPNQTQAVTATEGAIKCGTGVAGNTATNPLTSLFSAPVTSYNLLPGSSAVDSVPAGAIVLPFGLSPSTTDLAGNPRVIDGNGDCLAAQDRGALELQGHSAPCPTPPAKPVAGAITNLSVSPTAFFAAPSGATISKKKKAKKTFGATISYKDSQAATTTFTVLKSSSGRTQGKSCKKPSKANKHGKHCTIYTAIGSFTHTDTAGANKLHFSGRLNGKKLGKGSYRLQAVPNNAAGNGKAVSKRFKIK